LDCGGAFLSEFLTFERQIYADIGFYKIVICVKMIVVVKALFKRDLRMSHRKKNLGGINV